MNIPLTWLKSYVDIDVPIRQFMEDMTMTGSAAESHKALGAEIDKVVVGRIEVLDKHPNADKLLVCKVDIGAPEKLQIVTGATNLKVGDYVPVALHGASLSGGLNIKKGKLRGEVSEGMLCSIEELGYTKQDYPEAPEDGIYVFGEPQPLGADVKPILELIDDVIEFEIYSNRSDCQSVLGIAREVAATYGKKFTIPPINLKEQGGGQASDFIEVEIKNPDLCPRYVARVVKNITIEPSPQWMRRRLINAGLRPINNIVDITNYVMLEYGQPLHAFDIDEISDRKIIVRNATKDEKFTTLDGKEHQLDETMLVIADPKKAVALAGIMGGENSKVTGTASAILFESANFNGTNIRLSSKKLGMRTDASGKFEKGLDPNLPLAAVNRAMELIEELNCGEVVLGVVDNYPRPRESWTVNYNPERINRHLGTNINNMEELLALVGIEAKAEAKVEAKNVQAKIPTFRPDITCEADIAEEVARLFGYNDIPVNKAQRNITGGGKSSYQRGEDMIKRTMTALGYSEAMTASFEGPKTLDKLNIPADSPLRNAVTITNPLGEDFSILRTTPFNGILTGLSINFNRRNESARLFELAKVFRPRPDSLPDEQIFLTIAAYNRAGFDFLDFKGDIEELFSSMGVFSDCYESDSIPQMHPGRTARVSVAGEDIGHIGEIHPNIAEAYEIGGHGLSDIRAYMAVLAIKPIIEIGAAMRSAQIYAPLPKFPTTTRDIALKVKEDIPADSVATIIGVNGGPLLESWTLFDLYQGEQIEAGYKSMAYTLSFRSPDRTLTDEDVAAPMEAILSQLEKSLDIQLRDK